MTNVLIPTDFSNASFQLAKQAILSLNGRKLNITMFHAFEMPDPFELLDRCRKKPYQDLVNESFRQNCKQLKDQFPDQVQKICFNCMEGNTAAMFRNFAEANEIDFIIYPEHYQFIPANKISVDPGPLFKKSGIKLITTFHAQEKPVEAELIQVAIPVYAITG